ncbi:MAG: GNAT family N-acetyltransferase [Mesorhizobium sp.]
MNKIGSIDAIGAERLEIVSSSDRLAAIEAEWTSLWHRTDGLIFQSHAWVSAWWGAIQDRDRRALRIGLIWNDDKLVAVVPLAIGKRKGLRVLEWAASDHTDYGDILIAPECSLSSLRSLWVQLSTASGFDVAFLRRLLPDAAARKIFAPGAAGGMKLRPYHREEISYRVAGEWANGAAWLASLNKKMRQNYRRGISTLQETGDVKFRLVSPDEPLPPLLNRLSALKRMWLVRHTRESNLFIEGEQVLAALVDVLARAGVLRIFVLECNGAMVAVSINFVQHNKMMAFVTTYDPDFSRASPGTVLLMDYIQWSIDQGLREVDFLCGTESFKHRFSTRAVTMQSVLGTRTVQGLLASLADRAHHAFKGLRGSVQSAPSDPERAPAA